MCTVPILPSLHQQNIELHSRSNRHNKNSHEYTSNSKMYSLKLNCFCNICLLICNVYIFWLFEGWNKTVYIVYAYFRKLETVLKDDKLKLKQMQMFQPIFTEEQKRELLEVHPWIQKGELPQALANSVCFKDFFLF